MCYSALVAREAKYLESRFGIVVRTDLYSEYEQKRQLDPKKFPPLEDRIFPHHYAPVIFERDGKRTMELMRYSVYPPEFVGDQRKYDAVFNARRDNLSSPFWSDALQHRGAICIRGFFEWVEVKALLKAGVITIDQVKAEFEKQAAERKSKIEAVGKKYKPTPTELKDPRFRQIIIEFLPEREVEPMIVPVIFTEKTFEDGSVARGMAILTDDPPPEISIAGHDRCPIFLAEDKLDEWLRPGLATPEELIALLGHQRRILFTHVLPEAA